MLGISEEADKLRSLQSAAATALDPAIEDALLVMAEEFEEAATDLEDKQNSCLGIRIDSSV